MAQINSIFNFLKEYNEISNPVITEIGKQKWSLKLSELPQLKELWSIYHTQDLDSQKILEIKKPILEACPLPNEIIINWLLGNWRKASVENVLYKEFIESEVDNENGQPETLNEYFDEVEERVNSFNEWITKRNRWRTIELPKEQGLELYNNLYKLYSDMKKESESVELVLGDGHIYWKTTERTIDHSAILQRVQLKFDPEKPSFIVKFEEQKTEIYTPMLRVISSINQTMLSEIIQESETGTNHIADIQNNKVFFKRLINVLDEKGKLVDEFENGYSGPMIKFAPILFLRKRTLGFSLFIDKIIEELENNPNIEFPDFFENLIGNHKEQTEAVVTEDNWNESGIDEDILLTLPANNEQLKIIKFLNNYGAVLVQGPPGTGKTHTIANLIGHLLSQGLSVLVTSHTEKALSVLKDKVYKDPYNHDMNLQSLCISLLSSTSQKKEMDEAINEIAIKGTLLDLYESKKKIENLETERSYLIAQSKKKSQELLQIRALEYKDIVYDNTSITPIEAAKFIRNGRGSLDYIPGSTSDDNIGLPLSLEELSYLYSTNSMLSLDEEDFLTKNPPSIESFWSEDKFKTYVERYIQLKAEVDGWNSKIEIDKTIPKEKLSLNLDFASRVLSEIEEMDKFQHALLNKAIKDDVYISIWNDVTNEYDELLQYYEPYRKICFNNEYSIPQECKSGETLIVLNEIIDSGKEIPVSILTTVTKPKWKKLKDSIRNNGKLIEKREDFENVRIIIKYELDKHQIIKKIAKLFDEIGESFSLNIENFEEKSRQYRQKIHVSLRWHYDVWVDFLNCFSEICEDRIQIEGYKDLNTDNPIQHIKQTLSNDICLNLHKCIAVKVLEELDSEWMGFLAFLNKYKGYNLLIDKLYSTVENRNIDTYSILINNLSNILSKIDTFTRRKDLINHLEKYAQEWAEMISHRKDFHGESQLPVDIELAWKWRQLSNQMSRIDSYDANRIHKEIANMNEQLLQNARKLAYEKAWFEKIKNKTVAQTQAIEGWRVTIKKAGKMSTDRGKALMNKARELMPLCQSAIPVWIMPLNRVAENFDPQKNKFDVVIIDEASQADILALSALYLGKKVIIVGDDEQVSPNPVGIKQEEVDALIEQYLNNIPNKHIYDGKTSVYDMAKTSGFKPMMLIEHFRCLPEIIQFSNELSYNGRIRALREASDIKIKPSVVEYRVPNAFKTEKKINEVEAEHIASLVCACIENPTYRGKSIGVISMLGQEQAYEIDRLIQANLDPKEYENRKIQCGTASQFQGDERDVIFISIVECPNEKGGPVRLMSQDGNNDANRKKYNVAASRPRDQMWVVHSLNPEIDLKPDDIRLKLIKHSMNPMSSKNQEKLQRAESDFEKQVMSILLNRGYKVIPQWEVGSYRIDMVIENGDNRVALECDGEKFHNLDELPHDLKRQAILERLGWRFIRIRGSAFYRYPDETMEWLVEELESYGIKPNYMDSTNSVDETNQKNSEIINSIRRRAEQIRREWKGEVLEEVTDVTTEVDSAYEIHEPAKVIAEENIESANLVDKVSTIVNSAQITELDLQNRYYAAPVPMHEDKVFSEQLTLDMPNLNNLNLQIALEDLLVERNQQINLLNKEEIWLNKEFSSKGEFNTLQKEQRDDEIIIYLKEKGYRFIDNRLKGGALWIIGNMDIEKEIKELSSLGYHFQYAPNGGKATGHKPAWFIK